MHIVNMEGLCTVCHECGSKVSAYVSIGDVQICTSCIKKARRLVSEYSVDKSIKEESDINHANEL